MTHPDHCSYLLRLWRPRAQEPWRVTLFAVAQPDTPHHFATLEACFAFVQEQASTPDGCLKDPGATDAPMFVVETNIIEGEQVHVTN